MRFQIVAVLLFIHQINYKCNAFLSKSILSRQYQMHLLKAVTLDDFDLIIESIKIYRKEYGDFDIPIKFEIPAESFWPNKLHGMRLGKRLEKLLTSSEFMENYSDQVNAIAATGFNPVPEQLADEWDIVLKALTAYKQVHNDLRVPSKYEIPDDPAWPRITRGLRLGSKTSAIRSTARYIRDFPSRKALLEDLGFEWRLRDHTHKQQLNEDLFENIMKALQKYKLEISEDIEDIPSDFVVPSSSTWPEDCWGMKLGQQTQLMREKGWLVNNNFERETRLQEIGFTLKEDSSSKYSQKRFHLIYKALHTYKDIYGDLMVPQVFIVPSTEEWPEECWDLKLGARVNAIRSQGTLISNSPERKKMLEDLGFNWDLPLKKRKKTEQDVDEQSVNDEKIRKQVAKISASALLNENWRERFNSTRNDRDEEVSEITDALWEENRNMGMEVSNRIEMRFRSVLQFDLSRMFEPVAFREIAAETVADYMHDREMSSNPLIREVAHFEGHLTPQDFHGVITRQISETDINYMKNIGYKILEFGRFNWDAFLGALTVYRNIHGHVDVPLDYVVGKSSDEENLLFDEKWNDLELGQGVASVRCGDYDGYEDLERRKELIHLGFDWGDLSKYQRYRFVPMYYGLRIFAHLHGYPLPQSNFIVPDAPQWPYWMHGMRLGEWAAIARVQQKMITEHYEHRKEMLDAMDFLWWIPPGPIPQKYFEELSE